MVLDVLLPVKQLVQQDAPNLDVLKLVEQLVQKLAELIVLVDVSLLVQVIVALNVQ